MSIEKRLAELSVRRKNETWNQTWQMRPVSVEAGFEQTQWSEGL